MKPAGPALKQLNAHRAIHDAGQAHAKALTASMIQLFHEDKTDESYEAAKELIKHWEDKIIAHADTEDMGFFPELIADSQYDKKGIYMMMRDHDLFRQITADLKEKLVNEKAVTQEMIYEFTSMIIINRYHHIGEEKYIFHQK